MCTAESRQVPVGPGAVLASACLYAADPTVSRGCSDDVGASPARRASGAVHTTAGSGHGRGHPVNVDYGFLGVWGLAPRRGFLRAFS